MISVKSVLIACGVVLSALAVQASAASPGNAIKGRWTFNWVGDPSKQRCAQIEGALLAKLTSKAFVCDLSEATNSSSGAAFVHCKREKPDQDYMIFKTRALCEAERKTQAANGD
jgi:hypothetical protein